VVSARRAAPDALLITCEHGGNSVPVPYRGLFAGLQDMLKTHRGYDLGALLMARELSAAFKAPLVAATVTRLLVDLNRSVGHPTLHVAPVRALPRDARAHIVAEHYQPYRAQVEGLVERSLVRGRRVVHVSSHSFTPELHGQVRTADIGLLYDPTRAGEVQLCARWKAALAQVAPALRVRRNYPYEGKNDGFTSHLRRSHAPAAYVGVEIEINQAIVLGAPRRWADTRAALIASLRMALALPTARP
jgi:predicted N-formylglutamate amidohydrolase